VIRIVEPFTLRGDIVEVESSTTGTPLPERYKPAAPLAKV
jgi:hypothetical protein